MDGITNLVSELAAIASHEKAMLDECEELLASATYMQVRVMIMVQQHELCTLYKNITFHGIESCKFTLLSVSISEFINHLECESSLSAPLFVSLECYLKYGLGIIFPRNLSVKMKMGLSIFFDLCFCNCCIYTLFGCDMSI